MDVALRNGRELHRPNLPDRYARYKQMDKERHEDICSLAQAVEALKDELRNARVDLEDEQMKKREYRLRAEEAESTASRNQFALVLVDGDGYIFKEKFFQDALKSGGSGAASHLYNEIQNYLRANNLIPHAGDVEVMVNVYANKLGLARTLCNAGMIDHPNAFDKFVQSFTCGKRLFHFIDCGPGKERADTKLRDAYRFYAYIPQCRHIFLACCHDNGYVAELNMYRYDGTANSKTILVHAAQPAREYASLPFPVAHFGSVFETSMLMASRPVSHSQPPSGLTPKCMTPISKKLTMMRWPTAADTYASRSSITVPLVPVISQRGTSISNDKKKISPHSPNTFNKASTLQAAHSEGIPVNRAGQRIDHRLRQPRSMEQVRFEMHTKLCNEHQLRNNCYRQNCEYSHEDIDAEMMKTLRYKARKFPCGSGMECRRADCYLSHHCPWGNNCSSDNCIFSQEGMHDISDLEIAKFEPATSIDVIN